MFMNDADGNMLSDGRFTYHWDCENRLIAVEDKSGRVDVRDWRRYEFRYDYMGRQIGKKYYTWSKPNKDWMATPFKEVTFIYDGWNLIREDIKEHRSPTGGGGGKGKGQGGGGLPDAGEFTYSTNFYVWGLDLSGSLQGAGGIGGLLCMIPSSGGVAKGLPSASHGQGGFFYTFDGNGNVSELIGTVNGEPRTVGHYEYSPFGETIVSIGSEAFDNPFQFSTKYWDSEIGLNYYGYRFYSPSLGRWLSRDPMGEEGGLHLYAYVQNNPISRKDPLGQKMDWYERGEPSYTRKLRAYRGELYTISGEAWFKFIVRPQVYPKGKCCDLVVEGNAWGVFWWYQPEPESFYHEKAHIDSYHQYWNSLSSMVLRYEKKNIPCKRAYCYQELIRIMRDYSSFSALLVNAQSDCNTGSQPWACDEAATYRNKVLQKRAEFAQKQQECSQY